MIRRKNIWISCFAAICAGLIVYSVYLLQIRQVNLQETVYVVSPKQFIRANVVLNPSHLVYQPILKGNFHEDMVVDINEIIGKETVVPLGTNEPILRWKINQFQLLPLQNQSTFQIPKDYILSISNGIRAGDNVRLYISSDQGTPYRLFDEEVKVASVKSSANIEIDNPEISNMSSRMKMDVEKMYASRFEANGNIDYINLNLTEEQWLMIDRLCSARTHLLVVAFSSTSFFSE